jgi:hypothetical protein
MGWMTRILGRPRLLGQGLTSSASSSMAGGVYPVNGGALVPGPSLPLFD